MSTKKETSKTTQPARIQGIHGRGKSRDEGARPRTEGRRAREQEQGGRGKRRARGDRRAAGTGSLHGQRLHAIVTASAPALSPKTWYGMPAYANEDGKVVCFFQSA